MDQPKDPPPCPVLASNWKVLPSRGTEAHLVLLLKTSLALYGGEYNVLLMGHKSVVTTPSHTGEGWGGVRFSP